MNKITGLVYWLIAVLTFFACTAENAKKTTSVNEDDLIARLSSELVSSPTTKHDIEKNQLINYAIDNNIDVKSTPSGVFYYEEKKGTGDHPTLTDQLEAHYKGSLLDGKVFDSSYKRNKPLEFDLQQMIKGWQEVFPLLKPGSKAVLLIPSHFAYGPRGFPGLIPPNTPLRFDVELISIKKQSVK